jgi:hypothetical protein
MSPTVRTSKTIRARLAKRRAPRIAKTLTIDRHGLIVEGTRFPHYIGTDVCIDDFGNSMAIVTVGILAENVNVREPLPRGATVTWRHP